jgi:uncharacterized membrane-anchored protein
MSLNLKESSKATGFGRFELLALLGLAIVLLGFNYSVYTKEATLKSGVALKLALAPRDPRALMTGDYMALNTELANQIRRDTSDRSDGFVIVKPDERGVSRFIRIQSSADGLALNELALKFRDRSNGVRVGTDAFYFQEGQAQAFESARFGEYRLATNGDLLLIRMLDENLAPIVAIAHPPRQSTLQ